ncbi:hypothetical protein L1887_14601 [Cichorium endivia]|nr:hypothetical protein L1887_14601 [Cichorium endivia]
MFEDTVRMNRSSLGILSTGSRLEGSSENSDQVSDTTRTKCILRSLKGKSVKSESMRSPISDWPRISSEGPSLRILSPCPSNCSSKRMTSKKQSGRLEAFREEKDNVVSSFTAHVSAQDKGAKAADFYDLQTQDKVFPGLLVLD